MRFDGLAFAFLAAEWHRPVSREELMSVVWPDEQPREIDMALSAILSKLRAALKKVGLAASDSIEARSGTIQMRLPADAWIDIAHAANSIDEAEGALRAGDTKRAWGDVRSSCEAWMRSLRSAR